MNDMHKPPIRTYEILIIGGGPAGLSTALHLVKIAPELANKILVLEKAQYPREKLCAGGLTLDAETILNKLELNLNEIPFRPVQCANLWFEGKGLSLQPKNQATIKVIRRDVFDHWLAINTRKRGIVIKENTWITDMRSLVDGVVVETDSESYQGRVVIGADGSNGITRNLLFSDNKLKAARLLEVLISDNDTFSDQINKALFDFKPIVDGIGGYIWDFPTQVDGEQYHCYGIFDSNRRRNPTKPALKSVLFEHLEKDKVEPGKVIVKGHPLRLFNPSMQFSSRGVLMVGDAAGSDPLFGEGISLALGYGYLAASAIKESFTSNNFEFRTYRRDVLWSSLGKTLLLRKIIAKVLYSIPKRWFQRFIWHFLKPVIKAAGWLFVLNWSKRLYRREHL